MQNNINNKLRVSYQIPDNNQEGNEDIHNRSRETHCFSINSLVIDEKYDKLYTAGRDSTVRCWDVKGDIKHLYSYEHHSNWVNDVLICNENIRKNSN